VLVPFLEFAQINYGQETNVRPMQLDSAMKLIACKNIKKGDILVQQQAVSTQLDVFINSGFIPKNNFARNSAMITAQIDPSDPLFAVKLELIETSKNSYNFQIR
jgi:hypothetical protein